MRFSEMILVVEYNSESLLALVDLDLRTSGRRLYPRGLCRVWVVLLSPGRESTATSVLASAQTPSTVPYSLSFRSTPFHVYL